MDEYTAPFDDDETYTPSSLASKFGVSAQTIRNWTDQGLLPEERDPDGSRIYKGYQVKRSVKESDTLKGKLDDHYDDEPPKGKVQRLRERLARKEERISNLEDENEDLKRALDIVARLEQKMDAMQTEMKRRLPSGREEKKRSLTSYIPIIGRFIGT